MDENYIAKNYLETVLNEIKNSIGVDVSSRLLSGEVSTDFLHGCLAGVDAASRLLIECFFEDKLDDDSEPADKESEESDKWLC